VAEGVPRAGVRRAVGVGPRAAALRAGPRDVAGHRGRGRRAQGRLGHAPPGAVQRPARGVGQREAAHLPPRRLREGAWAVPKPALLATSRRCSHPALLCPRAPPASPPSRRTTT
jgi:hypothetical protein